MAIPFTLLALAFGLQLAIAGPAPPPRGPAALELVVAAIAIGTLYAINAWSLPVVAGLVALGALVRLREAPTRARAGAHAHVDGGGDACSRCWPCCRSCSPTTRRPPASAASTTAPRSRPGRATTGSSTACSPTSSSPPTSMQLVRSRHPWRTAGWALAAALFVGSLLAAKDLTAVVGLARAVLGRGARGLHDARAGRRALRLGADRRRAAVPADPGDGLRQGLVRRQRPLPHEHGLQARLPGVAAAGDRGRADHRVELGLAAAAGRGSRRSRGRCRCSRCSRSPRSIRWPAPTRARAASPTRRTSTGCAGSPPSAPGDPPAIEWLQRQRAARLGRARGGRRRLLGLRPRADLDLHRPADGDGLGRPRAPVGARPGHAPGRRREALPRARPPPRRARCSTATASATSSSARSSARPTATPAWRSGTSSAAASSTGTGRRSGSCGDRPRRPARGVGGAGLQRRGRRSWRSARSGCTLTGRGGGILERHGAGRDRATAGRANRSTRGQPRYLSGCRIPTAPPPSTTSSSSPARSTAPSPRSRTPASTCAAARTAWPSCASAPTSSRSWSAGETRRASGASWSSCPTPARCPAPGRSRTPSSPGAASRRSGASGPRSR